MSPEAKATIGAVVVLFGCAGIAAVVMAVSGCGGASKPIDAPGSSECLDAITHAVLSSETCNEAQARTDGLLVLYPACQGLFKDGGIDVCVKVRDGGHG